MQVTFSGRQALVVPFLFSKQTHMPALLPSRCVLGGVGFVLNFVFCFVLNFVFCFVLFSSILPGKDGDFIVLTGAQPDLLFVIFLSILIMAALIRNSCITYTL